MKWVKKGRIYSVENSEGWMRSHAQLPTPQLLNEDVLRIYYSTRNVDGISFTTYIDVMADDPMQITYVHDKPVLNLGGMGCFDDSGIMPSCIVTNNNRQYLYYVGWNRGVSVRYRVSAGLAVVDGHNAIFRKISDGPVLDRNLVDPFGIGNVFVLREEERWRMWYMSYCKWEEIGGVTEPYYVIKYAESCDGVNWHRPGKVCINFKDTQEAGIARPIVIKEDNAYKMWYSVRGAVDYRKGRLQSYRIGYAESQDGVEWVRKDNDAGIDVSDDGWDSEMIAYPYVYHHNGRMHMLYNGNGFGRSGFGYAVMDLGS